MSTIVIVLLAVSAAFFAIVIVLLLTGRRSRPEELSRQIESTLTQLKAELIGKQLEGLVSLRDTLESSTRTVNARLADGTEVLDRRLSLFAEVENKLGKLTEQTRTLEAIGNNIQSLSELLRPPKLRGIVGEILLENLLQQILPRALFEIQHSFSDGRKVDAIVKLGKSILPIDSKFPLEAFQRTAVDMTDDDAARRDFRRALKKHVDDIAGRYIVPDQGTTDFALMYIPSEAVYYHFISDVNPEAFGHALSRRVIPSSPGHLYAFLASISAVSPGMSMGADQRRLIAGLNEIAEITRQLRRWNERIEGSLRSLTNNMIRVREEEQKLVDTLEKVRHPLDEATSGDTRPD